MNVALDYARIRKDLADHASELSGVPDDKLLDVVYSHLAGKIARPDFNKRIAEKYTPKVTLGEAAKAAGNAAIQTGRSILGNIPSWLPMDVAPGMGEAQGIGLEHLRSAIRGPGHEAVRAQIPGGPIPRWVFDNPLDAAMIASGVAEVPKVVAGVKAAREAKRIAALLPKTEAPVLQAGIETLRAPAAAPEAPVAGALEYKPRPGATFEAAPGEPPVRTSPTIARSKTGQLEIVPRSAPRPVPEPPAPVNPPTPDYVPPPSVQAPPPPPGTEDFKRLIAGERTEPRGYQRGHVPTEGDMTIAGPPPPPGTQAFKDLIARQTPRSGAPQTSQVMREGSGPFTTSFMGSGEVGPAIQRIKAAISGAGEPYTAQREASLVTGAMERGAGAREAGKVAGAAVPPGEIGNIPILHEHYTLDRMFRAMLPKDVADRAIQDVSAPVRQGGTDAAEFTNSLFHRLEARGAELGIARGSRADKLAARYGEGKMSLDALKTAATNDWQNIQTWAGTARKVYKDLLTKINRVRELHGLEPVPERQDYITHTKELVSSFDKFGDMMSGLDSTPLKEAQFAKPQSPAFRFLKPRKGGSTTEGIYKSLEAYIPAASHQLFLTAPVQKLRGFEASLRAMAQAGDENAGKLANYLSRYTDDVAGKPDPWDSLVREHRLGAAYLKVSDWLSRTSSGNMITGSPGAATTNLIPVFTQAAQTTEPVAFARGLAEARTAPLKANPAFIDGQRSALLTRRFAKSTLGHTFRSNAEAAGGYLFRAEDEFSATAIVAGKYYEGVGKGLDPKEAMRLADEYAGALITDRSVGQKPLAYRRRLTRPLTQFQIEVTNQALWTLRDVPKHMGYSKAKVAQVLASMAVGSYLYNDVFETIFGRRPAFDPIHAVQRGIEQHRQGASAREIVNPVDRNSAGGEFVGNVPFGNLVSEKGGRFPLEAGLPDVKGMLAGTAKPKRELLKIPTYLVPRGILPGIGGAQARRMIEGEMAYRAGEVRKSAPKGKAWGQHMYDIPQTPGGHLRAVLLGKYSGPEARAYFNKGPSETLSERAYNLIRGASPGT